MTGLGEGGTSRQIDGLLGKQTGAGNRGLHTGEHYFEKKQTSTQTNGQRVRGTQGQNSVARGKQ